MFKNNVCLKKINSRQNVKTSKYFKVLELKSWLESSNLLEI